MTTLYLASPKEAGPMWDYLDKLLKKDLVVSF